MLDGREKKSLKDAVFITENTYLDGILPKRQYEIEIERLKRLTLTLQENSDLLYEEEDKEVIQKYAALYSLMTDSIIVASETDTLDNLPFIYDFNDSFGEKNWKNMFVTKLLVTRKGNCLPFLHTYTKY